jgi:hypothetical protein
LSVLLVGGMKRSGNGATTFSIMTFNIKYLIVALSITDIQRNDTQHKY